MDISVITPALITATVAILVGVLNQLWTTRRELQKYDREVYQKLYAPIFLSTYLWVDIHVTSVEKYNFDDNEIDNIKIQIIDHIGNNIAYSSSRLSLSFQKVNPQAKYFWYKDSDTPRRNELALILDFLNDFHQLVAKSWFDKLRGKISVLDRAGIKELERFQTLYLTWYLASLVGGSSKGAMFISSLRSYSFFQPDTEKQLNRVVRSLWNDVRGVGLKNRLRKIFLRKVPVVTFECMAEEIIKKTMENSFQNVILIDILKKAEKIDEYYSHL